MFSKVIHNNQIPPNFLNSILTNSSLYDMFKNDYEANRAYFRDLEQDEYLSAMLTFIESALFSSNLFGIYNELDDLIAATEGKLSYIKNFYDDFLLNRFKTDPSAILKTKFFQGMVYARDNDLYASHSQEFMQLFDYVFKKSLEYDDIVGILIKEPVRKLESDESLSMKEFDDLCNYIKNNTYGFISMEIVTKMLKNHAYKTNHIFDAEVVKSLVRTVAKSYLEPWGIDVLIEFRATEDDEEKPSDPNTIIIDERLIDKFLSLNYTEIFTDAFYALELLKNRELLRQNGVTYETLKTIMSLVSSKADPIKMATLDDYSPEEYLLELRASCFIKCLRFFQSFGVNLFESFIESGLNELDIDIELASPEEYSPKEISLDQRFLEVYEKREDKKDLVKHFKVLSLLYDRNGTRLKTIDIIKKWFKTEYGAFIEEYLHSRIMSPEMMIEDVADLSLYRPRDEDLKSFIEKELKYIYVDSFYYSLDSFLKFKSSPKFDREEYLLDLAVKVNCLSDTPLTHRFIDEAIFTIEDMKQSD